MALAGKRRSALACGLATVCALLAASAALSEEAVAELKQLKALHEEGVLEAEEWRAHKAVVLKRDDDLAREAAAQAQAQRGGGGGRPARRRAHSTLRRVVGWLAGSDEDAKDAASGPDPRRLSRPEAMAAAAAAAERPGGFQRFPPGHPAAGQEGYDLLQLPRQGRERRQNKGFLAGNPYLVLLAPLLVLARVWMNRRNAGARRQRRKDALQYRDPARIQELVRRHRAMQDARAARARDAQRGAPATHSRDDGNTTEEDINVDPEPRKDR